MLEGSFYDHDGICRAGEFVWRKPGSFHETHSDEGAVLLAVYRKPNIFKNTAGFYDDPAQKGFEEGVAPTKAPGQTPCRPD